MTRQHRVGGLVVRGDCLKEARKVTRTNGCANTPERRPACFDVRGYLKHETVGIVASGDSILHWLILDTGIIGANADSRHKRSERLAPVARRF
jgi:hypothetical protein